MLTSFSRCWLLACCAAFGCRGDVTCESCRITRSTVAWLAGTDADAAGAQVAAIRAGQLVRVQGRVVVEHDAKGTLLRKISLDQDSDTTAPFTVVAVLGGDSLIVAEKNSDQLRILGSDRSRIGSVQLPRQTSIRSLMTLDRFDRVIFSGSALGQSGLFLATIDSGFLVLDAAFRPPAAPTTVRAPDYRLARTRAGVIWAVEVHSYDMLAMRTDGSVIRHVERKPRWFVKPTRGRPRGRLRSRIAAVWVDGADRLWVYSTRPTDAAAAAWRSAEARRPGGTVTRSLDELYETVVEVLTADASALLATGSIPGLLVGLASDGRAIMYQRMPDGPATISVQRLQFHEASRRD